MKKCSRCGKEKEIEEFSKNKKKKDGIDIYCKECFRKYHLENKNRITKKEKEYRLENKEKISKRKKKYNIENKERISEYNKKQYINNKEKNIKRAKEYREENKEKIAERERKYRLENKEKVTEKERKYYLENKEEITKKTKKYREENKEKIVEKKKKYNIENKEKSAKYQKEYCAWHYKNNINFKIAINIRNRLNSVIKRKNIEKIGSSIKDLGCSVSFLKQHLELKFAYGMTWDNYGKRWQIDHIIPLSAFNLENEIHFKAACNYRNLQPLWTEENLSKNNKYNIEDFNNYLQNFKNEG